MLIFFFFSSRRRHTRYIGDWSSDVCSSDLGDKRKELRPAGRCAHNWTSPVTSRSEQPIPVTRFAITCETSTAPSKNRKSFSREMGAPQQDILGRGFLMMRPGIKPTARVT